MPRYYYGLNLLENPYAADGLVGWVNSGVTVEVGGSYGANNWVLSADAEMSQEITEEEDLVDSGDFYRIRVDFKLNTLSDVYTTTAKARAILEFHYDDGTIDIFSCILSGDQGKAEGIIPTDWNLGEGHCDTQDGKTLTKVVVKVKTIGMTDGLDIDHIRLQKAFDPAQAVYGDITSELEEGTMPVVIFTKNNHLMIDRWGISPDFIKRHPNMVKNSGFERYDAVTNIPHDWVGNGVVTIDQSWEGRACLKLEPAQIASQEIDPF